MQRPDLMSWWAHRYHRRFVVGVLIVLVGFLWRVRGPVGDIAVYNERVPDVRQADLLIIPLIGLGLLLVSSRPGVRLVDRVIGTGLLLLAGSWLVTKHPLLGPIVWSGPGQHGVHLGDSLAAIPGLIGLQILLRSPVPGTRSDPAIRAARRSGLMPGVGVDDQARPKDRSG